MGAGILEESGSRSVGITIMERWRLRLKRINLKHVVVTAFTTLLLLLVLTKPHDHMQETNESTVIAVAHVAAKRGTSSQAHSNIREIHRERKEKIQEVCSRNGVFPQSAHIIPEHLKYIYVDDAHEFMYCAIPKVACTNWKRVLLVLSGHVNRTNPFDITPPEAHSAEFGKHLRTLDMYSPEEVRYRMDKYFKFMFVRDPFERILSAYRNKFTVSYNKYFPERYGKHIIQKFRKKPSKQSLKKGTDVRFGEFVQYLLDEETAKPFNLHWRQYYKICYPCVVQYDAIGKYETLDDDMDYILNEAGISDVIKFPQANTIPGRPKTSDVLAASFANISSYDIHRLWELYSVDFSMFGYSYPDFTGLAH